jgi:hypothetical protein
MLRFPMRPHVRVLATTTAVTALAIGITVPSATAHEDRDVSGYEMVVGFIDEPVYVAQKSGLEFFVTRDDAPVTGLEETLDAEVTYGGQTLALELGPRFGEEGAYQSVFFPTAAGPYTFRIFGTIEGTRIDESFTSSEEGFDEVREAASGQFPVQFPPPAELAQDARRGADAAGLVTIALGAGVLGVVLGLVALVLVLTRRRRAA